MDGVVGIVALFSLVRSQTTMATRMEAWRPWRRELPVARLKTWRNTMATPFRPVDGGWVEFMWDSYQLNVKPGLIHRKWWIFVIFLEVVSLVSAQQALDFGSNKLWQEAEETYLSGAGRKGVDHFIENTRLVDYSSIWTIFLKDLKGILRFQLPCWFNVFCSWF